MDKQTHDAEHDSKVAPQPGCPFCAVEVLRRVKRCFGDGSGSIPTPKHKEG